MEEGVVAGGGVALVRVAAKLASCVVTTKTRTSASKVAPARHGSPAASNRHQRRRRSLVIANAVKNGEGNYGYNAYTEQYGDMLAMGILDPTKVTVLPCSSPRPSPA